MTQEVKRSYLEINSIQDLEEVQKPSVDYSINLLDPIDFQLNKFFYKNIGKKHRWVDRLVWMESKWIDYVSDKKIKTYVFKYKNELAGFFELIFHYEKKEHNHFQIFYYMEFLFLKFLQKYYFCHSSLSFIFLFNP